MDKNVEKTQKSDKLSWSDSSSDIPKFLIKRTIVYVFIPIIILGLAFNSFSLRSAWAVPIPFNFIPLHFYTVGGTVSGLLNSRSVVLQNNGGDNITVSANGSFTFSKKVAHNNAYSVTVLTEPANEICSVTSASGTATGDVTTISVSCTLVCTGLAGGAWVKAPGDSNYSTSDFCVQKYTASDVSGTPTSQAGTLYWNNNSLAMATTACSTLGAEYHLITNPEWMTIGTNIAGTASNWSGGSVGSGTLPQGHSDGSPSSTCAADANDANAWVQTTCTGTTQGALAYNQKRTNTLSNGSVVWDFGGNAWQLVNYTNASDKPYVSADGGPTGAWRELSAVNTGFTTTPLKMLRPINAEKSWWNNSWNTSQGIGGYYAGNSGTGGQMRRGGVYTGMTGNTGPFTTNLNFSPSSTSSPIAFRCVFSP